MIDKKPNRVDVLYGFGNFTPELAVRFVPETWREMVIRRFWIGVNWLIDAVLILGMVAGFLAALWAWTQVWQ